VGEPSFQAGVLEQKADIVIIIASSNGMIGMAAGWEILSAGGSALDAVETATRLVEDNPEDHSVGYGGYPNLLGEVELDASIMDGATLRAGAVGALKGFRYPISVARRVMEELPHVFLVGEGAARFAAELSMTPENLLSPEAERTWREGIEGRGMIDWHGVSEQVARLLARAPAVTKDPEHVTGTVNFIAQDAQGRIASAVSTSGWAWKYPSRLGDSPIIGAGNYADDRYGAAACTGWGEAAIRAGTARSVVLYLKQGLALEEACREAFRDLEPIMRGTPNAMSLVALDRHGNHCAMTTAEDRSYVYQADGMAQAAELPRTIYQI
jgi:L-asparaginase / beta-aspartyl-peptidase